MVIVRVCVVEPAEVEQIVLCSNQSSARASTCSKSRSEHSRCNSVVTANSLPFGYVSNCRSRQPRLPQLHLATAPSSLNEWTRKQEKDGEELHTL